MWIMIFFIKFDGNIENVRGEAENIFNITREFNEINRNPRIFLIGKKI